MIGLVDEVWVVPVKKHPWEKHLASFKHRIKMLESIYQYFENVRVMPFQGKIKVPQKTLLFMRWLRKFTQDEFDFSIVVGSDNACEIKKWYRWEQLVKENRFIIVNRGSRWMQFETHPFAINRGVMLFNDECVKRYSATEIRGMVKWKGKEKEEMQKTAFSELHANVVQYIKEHKLYGYKDRN